MSVGPVGPGGGKYSIIEDVAFKEYLKKKRSRGQTILDICSFAYVCGPRGGIYSIIEDAVQVSP